MALVLNGTTGASMVQDDAVNPVTDIASGIPCFSAYQSVAQSIASTTWTKINLQTKEFDTTNAFDNVTFRFQPLVAGYYAISYTVGYNSPTTSFGTCAYKNGSPTAYGTTIYGTASSGGNVSSSSSIIYLNGSTDYLELYGYAIGTTPTMFAMKATTFFQAHLIVGA